MHHGKGGSGVGASGLKPLEPRNSIEADLVWELVGYSFPFFCKRKKKKEKKKGGECRGGNREESLLPKSTCYFTKEIL